MDFWPKGRGFFSMDSTELSSFSAELNKFLWIFPRKLFLEIFIVY